MRPARRGAPPLPSLGGLSLHLQSKPVAPTMVNFRESQQEECLLCSAPLHVGEYGVLNPADLVDMDNVDLFRSAWRTSSLRCGHRFHRRCLASHFGNGGPRANVPVAQRLCPVGQHYMDVVDANAQPQQFAPNGVYQHVNDGPSTPQSYVHLSADDSADIDRDIQNGMFVPPNPNDSDDAYHNNQEKQWYNATLAKRDQLRQGGSQTVVDAAKWADRLKAMEIERNRYKKTWDVVKEKLVECEEQLRDVNQERQNLQEQNRRLAQSGGNDEEAAKIIDDMIKENASLKNEIEKQNLAALTQEQILSMHERRFESDLAQARNSAKLAEDATKASEQRVVELERGMQMLETKLKDVEYTNSGNEEQLLYERTENAKQMASMEEELGKAKDELAACNQRLTKKQEDLTFAVKHLKGQYQEYRAGMEARLAQEQEECEAMLRALKRELEDCEEELRRRGSGPPEDEEEDDAERRRIADEAAAALVARTLDRAVEEAAVKQREEQREEQRKQREEDDKKRRDAQKEWERVRREEKEKNYMKHPIVVSVVQALTPWKERIAELVEDLTGDEEVTPAYKLGNSKILASLSAYGVRLFKAFNRLVIMGRIAGTVDPEDYMQNLRLAKGHPNWQENKFETINKADKWMTSPDATEWWMRDGGAALNTIAQVARMLAEVTADLEFSYKEGQKVAIHKAAEDNQEAEEAGQKVKEYMEKEGFDESTTEEQIRVRDAIAKAVALKGKAMLWRATAGLDASEAELAYVSKSCQVIHDFVSRLQTAIIPFLRRNGGDMPNEEEDTWMAQWVERFYEAPGMVAEEDSWRFQGKRRRLEALKELERATKNFQDASQGVKQLAVSMENEARGRLFDAEILKSESYDQVIHLQQMLGAVEKGAGEAAERIKQKLGEARMQFDRTQSMCRRARGGTMSRVKKFEMGTRLSPRGLEKDLGGDNNKEALDCEIEHLRFELGFRERDTREQSLMEAASYLWATLPTKDMDSHDLEKVVNECRLLLEVMKRRLAPLTTAFFRQVVPAHFSVSRLMNWLCYQFQNVEPPEDHAGVEGSLAAMLKHPIMIEECRVMTEDAMQLLTAAEALAKEANSAATQSSKSAATGMQILRKSLEHFNAQPQPVEEKERELLTKRVHTVEKGYSDAVDYLATANARIEDIVKALAHSDPPIRGDVDWQRLLNDAWAAVVDLHPPLDAYNDRHKAMKYVMEEATDSVLLSLGMEPPKDAEPSLIEALREFKKHEVPVLSAIASTQWPLSHMVVLYDEKLRLMFPGEEDVALKTWVTAYAILAKFAVRHLRQQIFALFDVERKVAYDLGRARDYRRTGQVRFWLEYHGRVRDTRHKMQALEFVIKGIFTEYFPDWGFAESVADHWAVLAPDLKNFSGSTVEIKRGNEPGPSSASEPGPSEPSVEQSRAVIAEVSGQNLAMLQEALRRSLGHPDAERVIDEKINRMVRSGRVRTDNVEWNDDMALQIQRVRFLLDAMDKEEKFKWWCRLLLSHGSDETTMAVVNALKTYGKARGWLVPDLSAISLGQLAGILPQLPDETRNKLIDDIKRAESDDAAIEMVEYILKVPLLEDARLYIRDARNFPKEDPRWFHKQTR